MTAETSKDTLSCTTGYSSIPSNYDSYVAKAEAEAVFGRNYVPPSFTPPMGTIGMTPDPKLNKLRNQDNFSKHTLNHPEDWRAKAVTTDTTVAVKHDLGKTDWSLMPFECIEEINKVLDFGAKKYAAHNWKTGSGFRYTRVLSSLLRHTFAWARGEDLDPESGLSHLSHMGCNVIFLIYYNKYRDRYSNDDRVTS